MEIDLCDRGIAELCFQPEETSTEEAAVASTVGVLLAHHNNIVRVSGLDTIFTSLVELRLSHNNLGKYSSSCVKLQGVRSNYSIRCGQPLCDGVASWIRALPRTLQVLDVSFNHLSSFMECHCASPTQSQEGEETESTRGMDVASVNWRRHLRHQCPLTLSLFFPPSHFPVLQQLNVSNNNFAVSLRESDDMEAAFRGADVVLPIPPSRIASLDISYNASVSSLNCFLLHSQSDTAALPMVSSVHVEGTGLDDLAGLSAMETYGTSLANIFVYPTPVCRAILTSSSEALLQLLQTVLPQSTDDVARLRDSKQFAAWEEAITMQLPAAVQEMWLRTFHADHVAAILVYVRVLREVVPSLQCVDGVLEVENCEMLLLESLRRAVESGQGTEQTAVSGDLGIPPLHPSAASDVQRRRLRTVANCVAPELRSRVVIGQGEHNNNVAIVSAEEDDEDAPQPGRFHEALAALQLSALAPTTKAVLSHSTSTGVDSAAEASSSIDELSNSPSEDWFTPVGLPATQREVYDALCREAQQLQEDILASNERTRSMTEHAIALRDQLKEDRILVRDQLKEISAMKAKQEALQKRVEKQRQRLEKRRREVRHGIIAIQSREVAAREQAALQRVEKREKEVAKREKQLRVRLAMSGALAVDYHNNGPSGKKRKLRSEILREEAVRQRIAVQENKDPFAYSPTPFKAERRRLSPQRRFPPAQQESACLVVEAEEQQLFTLYEQERAVKACATVDQYLANLPPLQRQQLSDAYLSKSPHSDVSQQPTRSSTSLLRSQASTFGDDHSTPQLHESRSPQRAPGAQDLSSLSLSELLDAADAIRKKQAVLQQLHLQWKRPAPVTPSASPSALTPPSGLEGNDESGREPSITRCPVHYSSASVSLPPPPPAAPSPPSTHPTDARTIFDAVMQQKQQPSPPLDDNVGSAAAADGLVSHMPPSTRILPYLEEEEDTRVGEASPSASSHTAPSPVHEEVRVNQNENLDIDVVEYISSDSRDAISPLDIGSKSPSISRALFS